MLKKSEKFRRFVTASLNHPDRRFQFRKEILVGEQRKTVYVLCWYAPDTETITITAQRRHVGLYTYSLPVADIPAEHYTKTRKRYLHTLWLGFETKLITILQKEAHDGQHLVRSTRTIVCQTHVYPG